MDFFRKNTTPKIVEKHTTFNYSRKTPKQIIEERENKKLNVFKKRIYRFVSTVIYSIGGILGIVLKSSYYMNILSIVLMITTALLIIGKGVDIYEKKVSE